MPEITSEDVKLSRAEVARFLGWKNVNSVYIAEHNTRNGTAKVPFPLPDGRDVVRKLVNATRTTPYWYSTTIDLYRRQKAAFPRGRVTPEITEQIRRLHVDGLPMDLIGEKTGVSKATVHRVIRKARETVQEAR